jgi:5,5'-dehydrodivanillate O-demethylase
MENRGDPGHAVYLHGRLFQYALERQGRLSDDPKVRYNATMHDFQAMRDRGVYVKYRVVPNEFGFTKGSLMSDQSEDARSWTIGQNPIIFPYMLAFGPENGDSRIRRLYQIGVPIDDTHTWHFQYCCYVFPDGVDVPQQDAVPYRELPVCDERGEPILEYVLAQDMVAWYAQGEIADRSGEHLGSSDALVIAYRQLLKKQIDIVRDGGEPMNVFRDAAQADRPELRIPGNETGGEAPVKSTMFAGTVGYRERYHVRKADGTYYIDDDVDGQAPDRDIIIRLFAEAERVRENAKQPLVQSTV